MARAYFHPLRAVFRKPKLHFLPSNGGSRPAFGHQIKNRLWVKKKEKKYLRTWLVFRFSIQTEPLSDASIRGYEIEIDEFDLKTANIVPASLDHIRLETGDQISLQTQPSSLYDRADGSLNIGPHATIEDITLPFAIEFSEKHKDFDSITARLTLIHGSNVFNRRKFQYETLLTRI